MSRSAGNPGPERQILDSIAYVIDQFPGDGIKRIVVVLESGRKVPLPVACPVMLGQTSGLTESQEKLVQFLRGRKDGMTPKSIFEGINAEGEEYCLSTVEKGLKRLKALGCAKCVDGEWILVEG